MADNNDIQQNKEIVELFEAFMRKHRGYVFRFCLDPPKDPLDQIALHNETFLHMAARSKQKDLVLNLLGMLPADANIKLSHVKNGDGNTVLHEVATSDTMVDLVEKLLGRDADLLIAANDLGEKPIFCAARYGQTKMFKLLARKMRLEERRREEIQIPEESKAHLRRNDRTTVLHISIASECFGLALYIAESYPYLIKEEDQFSMTPFQYIACNSTIFRRRGTQRRREFLKQPTKSKIVKDKGFNVLLEHQGFIESLTNLDVLMHLGTKCWEAMCDEPLKMRTKRESLKNLICTLIEDDTLREGKALSQDKSKGKSKIEEHSPKLPQDEEGPSFQEFKKSNESPLFLATVSNIEEIIYYILNLNPQALTDTNKEGMNILHVAILYRHIDIFDMVVKYEVLARKLLSDTDKKGNSVLHMVSQRRMSQVGEKMQNPGLELQHELLLFEKVKSASKMLVSNPLNEDNKTAEELFAESNEELHRRAKEWLMRTTENCTILSIFIATVAFAAAYTVPGGPNQDTGIPILHSKPFFVVFITADVISLTLALTSVGKFLSILTSSFLLEDFKTYLFKKLIQGIICLVLSVSMMAVAFGANIVLIMKHNGKISVWDVVAFLPVPIFFLSYSPLRSAVLGPCREVFKIFVNIVVVIFFFLLPYGAFKGLCWTLKKAYVFICKTVSRKKSHTQSPQPPTAPPTRV